MDVISLKDALPLFVSGGLSLMFLFEGMGWFQNLSPTGKWGASLGITVGLSVIAGLILAYCPPDVLAALDPLWQIVQLFLYTYPTSQAGYRLYKVAVRNS